MEIMKYTVAFFLATLTAYAQSDAALRALSSTLWAGRNLLQNTNLLSMTNGQVLMMVGTNIVATNSPGADLSGVVAKAGDTMTGDLITPNLTVPGTITTTNFNAEEIIAQIFTVAGMPRDIRADGAVEGEEIVTSTSTPGNPGSARMAIEAAIAAGVKNVSIPAGTWNMYQGYDTSLGRSQGILIDGDFIIQGVRGETVLDFGRTSDANLQVEFIHVSGRLILKDVSCINFNYLIAQRYDIRDIDEHTTVIVDGGDHVGGALLAPMWTGFGPFGGGTDIYRTNIAAGFGWNAGAGWTESGGHYTYAQPAAQEILAVMRTNYLATVVTTNAHGLSVGDWVTVTGCALTVFNLSVVRVAAVPETNWFSYYTAGEANYVNTAQSGNVYVLGKLSIPHPYTLRAGDLIRDRISVDNNFTNGFYLYAGGALQRKRIHSDEMTAIAVQRTGSGTPRYAQINATGHEYLPGDQIQIDDTGDANWDDGRWTVVGGSSTDANYILCTPDPVGFTTYNAAPFTLRYYPVPCTAFAKSGTTVTLTATNHGWTVGAMITLRATEAAVAAWTNRVWTIQSVINTNLITVFEPTGGNLSSNVLAGAYLQNTRSEIESSSFDIDNDIYIVPTHTFAGTVKMSEVYLANWQDTYLQNLSFHTPPAFSTVGRSGITLQSGQRITRIDNCRFSGGAEVLYIGRADSVTCPVNPGPYNRQAIINDCQFYGIGISEFVDGRAIVFHGRDLSVLNSRFERVGYGAPGYTVKGSRQAIWYAAEHATFRGLTFYQCGDARVVLCKVGGLGTEYGQWISTSGNPANWSSTWEDCVFDGTGSDNLQVIEIDGKPDDFVLQNCLLYNYPDVTSPIKLGGTGPRFAGIDIFDTTIRDMPKATELVGSSTMPGLNLRVHRSTLRNLGRVSYLFTLQAPRLFEFHDNEWDRSEVNRVLGTGLLRLYTNSTYNIGTVSIQNTRAQRPLMFTSTGWLISMPSSNVVMTNLIVAGNRIGSVASLIQNFGSTSNVIQRAHIWNNEPGWSVAETVQGLYVRSNAVQTPIPLSWITDSTAPAYAKAGDLWLSNSIQVYMRGTNAAWVPVNNP